MWRDNFNQFFFPFSNLTIISLSPDSLYFNAITLPVFNFVFCFPCPYFETLVNPTYRLKDPPPPSNLLTQKVSENVKIYSGWWPTTGGGGEGLVRIWVEQRLIKMRYTICFSFVVASLPPHHNILHPIPMNLFIYFFKHHGWFRI